jgi:hypothetical protein
MLDVELFDEMRWAARSLDEIEKRRDEVRRHLAFLLLQASKMGIPLSRLVVESGLTRGQIRRLLGR